MVGDGPLAGVRVIDMADGIAEMCGRFLADLGAEVILVEPPSGIRSRTRPPFHGDLSIGFVTHHANKRSVVIDLDDPDGRVRLLELLDSADIWLETTTLGALAEVGIGPDEVLARNPQLVIVSITDFGQNGPYRDYQATEWVHLALAGVLSRSGKPGRPPLAPPGSIVDESAAVQAAWAALVAYWNRLETGIGDHVDFSRFESTVQLIDPAFGAVGTAAMSNPFDTVSRGRPDSQWYPIFPCADGHVRIAILGARQWHGMRAWLGEPDDLVDPSLDVTANRLRIAERIHGAIGQLFRDKPTMDLVAEGQRRGVPIAPLLTPGEVLETEHFRARGALIDAEVAPGLSARIPAGYVELDGQRAGFRHRAPSIGEHDDEVLGRRDPTVRRQHDDRAAVVPCLPLAGLRVLDLGVIVLGAEAGRLFADQGAEVIKIENSAHPDGLRNANRGSMAPTFVAAQRGKKSFGVDLRHPEGAEILRRLVAVSDVVLSNFQPSTLDSLGLGASELRRRNPRLVVASSSALGATGPWRDWMGYGPLVRAVTSVSELWRYPEAEESFSDSTTVYPDHFAARVIDVAALAALIGRRRTGQGVHVQSSMAEAILMSLSDVLAREWLDPGTAVPRDVGEHDAPWGVYPCAGDDEWCVVTIRNTEDWIRLCGAIGRDDFARRPGFGSAAGRVSHRSEIDEVVSSWTASRSPTEVERLLQAARVPAGRMQRVTEYRNDPQLLARGFFRALRQPGVDEIVTMESGAIRASTIAEPDLRPAPEHGEHTREICASLLAMDGAEIDRLVAAGVLQEPG